MSAKAFGLPAAGVLVTSTLLLLCAVPVSAQDPTPSAQDAVNAVYEVPGIRQQTVKPAESPANIPSDLSQPVTFDGLPVKVSVKIDGTSKAAKVDGLAVFRGTSDSTSTVVQPTENGARFLTVIGSSDAPREYSYDLELDAGATLQPLEDGSISVIGRNGVPAAGIAPPWAVDANGLNLPTSYQLDGQTLVQRIDLTDAALPVTADPSIYDLGGMNGAEKSFCSLPSRWSICNTARQDSNTASSAAQRSFASSLHNGKGDAFRHCYWSALMTIHMGRATAAGFGDRHEMIDGNPNIERVMDQRNNAIGRDSVGISTGSPSVAASRCASRARSGALWTIENRRLV